AELLRVALVRRAALRGRDLGGRGDRRRRALGERLRGLDDLRAVGRELAELGERLLLDVRAEREHRRDLVVQDAELSRGRSVAAARAPRSRRCGREGRTGRRGGGNRGRRTRL